MTARPVLTECYTCGIALRPPDVPEVRQSNVGFTMCRVCGSVMVIGEDLESYRPDEYILDLMFGDPDFVGYWVSEMRDRAFELADPKCPKLLLYVFEP